MAGKKLYTPYLPPASSSTRKVNTITTPTPEVDGHEPGSENPLMEMLRLYSKEDLDQCPTDKWGILDPGLERYDDSKGSTGSRENGGFLLPDHRGLSTEHSA